ncbi:MULTISPECIES: TonB-dependent receptor [Sphingobacterium]|uniref:TonB-dependent receptor n=1 Tax=Sphingobacterium populi TaxID=1812824 RepID=A0ABW5U9M1_9SPHI|nr:TonB-dependent receptor [Sphingobacterium sp. CFCC 11742]
MKFQKILTQTAFLAMLTGVSFEAAAQQREETEKPVAIDSFVIVRDYRPLLADAVKIRRSPDMTNKREYMPRLTYGNVPDKKLDINTGLSELKIMETPFIRSRDTYSNYVKAGVGNLGTILGEAYFAVEDYEDIRFGGFVKHLNQKGSLDDQRFSRQEVGAFGRRVFPTLTIDGQLGYNRLGTNFYGIPVNQEGNSLNPSREGQVFNDLYFTGEMMSNFDPENEDALSFSLKADAYTFSDRYDTRENSFALGGFLNKRVRTFNVGVNAAVDINNVEGAMNMLGGSGVSNSVASANPYISFKGANYTIQLGANLVSEFGDVSSFNIFPKAEIDFSLVPEYFYIFGGVTGGVERGPYREFARLNPFLASGITIQNTIERMHAYGGIKGNAGATFGWKAKAFYRQLEGMALFVNNVTNPFQFDLVYDGDGEESVKHVGIEGEINIRVSEAVNLGGRLNIDNYTMAYQAEAWHTPNVRLTANARFNISEKLYIDAEALFHGQTSARTFSYNSDGVAIDPTAPRVQSIPSFLDLSAGAEYKATKQLGIFVKANNMLNNEYQRYLYYPRLGFNVIGGLNFSF